MNWHTFQAHLARFIQSEQLVQPHDAILAAVSGGVDSVLMLRGLLAVQQRLSIRELGAVYVDHNLRPDETPVEKEWVRQLAQKHGIRFSSINLDLEPTMPSLQNQARAQRRRALSSLMEEWGWDWVATGHHADDQAETLLQRMLRGTSPKGLAGIHPRQGRWIHPLLPFSRNDIEAVAKEIKQDWLEDPSNRTTKYNRNKIRLELLPHLETNFNPNLSKGLCQLASAMRDDEDFFQQQLEDVWETLVHHQGEEPVFVLEAWDSLHPSLQRRALTRFLALRTGHPECLQVTLDHLMQWLEGREGEAYTSLQDGWQVIRRYNVMLVRREQERVDVPAKLRLNHEPKEIQEFNLEITKPGRYPYPDGVVWVESMNKPLQEKPEQEGMTLVWEVFLAKNKERETLESTVSPWSLRYRRPGDRLDFGTHHRPLKKWLIDAKIPRSLRWNLPLLVKDGCIYGVATLLCLPPLQRNPTSLGWRIQLYAKHIHSSEVAPNGDPA
ncbi:MAG: tRNA lysidine(34) synthetase TilS [Deltaproteobacteria bacterium]|nr:MAG: tRNA lysidine(34) synthetase TilS [Deltaproteobacteria bacterium]